MTKNNLFGTDLNATRVVQLSVDKIETDPNQPRKHFDPAALSDLAQSIDQNGLIQPITVRKHDLKDDT